MTLTLLHRDQTKCDQIVILGTGDHARVVADACRAAGREVRGFLAGESRPRVAVAGLPVLGGDELLNDPSFVSQFEFVVGVGDQHTRRRLALLVHTRRGALASIAHPSAVVAPDVRVGGGTVLVAGCVINTGATLGAFVIVNTGATVDHDCILEDGVQIGPGAHLGGRVTCHEDAFIGIGANILPGKTIGARAVVGAGAVVITDVPPDVTVVGCPARIIKPPR